MNIVHQGVVTLFRSAITGENLQLPEGFTLEAADELIRKQSLLPLAYRGAYICGISRETDLMRSYEQKYYRNLIRDTRQRRAVEQLCHVFEENGIDYLPLKGCNLKKLYPQPELRPMGDADILIRLEQYDKIPAIMEKLGYAEENESSYDFPWKSADLYVELHKGLFPPVNVDLCSYFKDAWDLAAREQGHRYYLTAEDEYAFIFAHMAKHFRSRGIGARQIIDLYVYRQANPQMDEQIIEAIVSRLKMTEFYHNIMRLLDVWFLGAPADPVTEYMTEYVLGSGSWGTLENELITSEIVRSKKNGKVSNSKFMTLLNMVFLPLVPMQKNYNVLYKYPVLLPVFWVVRWFDVLINRRRNITKKFAAAGKISDEKVIQRQKMLNYMGLDFHYEDLEDE